MKDKESKKNRRYRLMDIILLKTLQRRKLLQRKGMYLRNFWAKEAFLFFLFLSAPVDYKISRLLPITTLLDVKLSVR